MNYGTLVLAYRERMKHLDREAKAAGEPKVGVYLFAEAEACRVASNRLEELDVAELGDKLPVLEGIIGHA